LKVLITGGAGFVGSNLAISLVEVGHEVLILDNLATGSLSNLEQISGMYEVSIGDVRDVDLCRKLAESVDTVVHLAALPSVARSVADPVSSNDVNVNGTISILDACRNSPVMPHFIFASSSSVYGANPCMPKIETLQPLPSSPYAASKLAGEAYSLAFQRSYGLPVTAFRFFNIFGPKQKPNHAYAAVVPAIVWAMLRGETFKLQGDGQQSRDFTFVGTVVDVLKAVIEGKLVCDTPVNLAHGRNITINSLISKAQQTLGMQLTVQHVEPRVGDVRASQADSAALLALVPDVVPVDIEFGLLETCAWMRSVLVDETPA
jgi:UDP-glucose 4-epimerase